MSLMELMIRHSELAGYYTAFSGTHNFPPVGPGIEGVRDARLMAAEHLARAAELADKMAGIHVVQG